MGAPRVYASTLVGATTGHGATCLWRCLTLVSPGVLCPRPVQHEAPAQHRRSQTEPWGYAGPC